MLFRHKIRTRIRRPRVLVVDDEVQLAELLRAMLEAAGLDVCVIYDAADAPRKIDEFKPDLLLSDVRMPEMRGDELLFHLNEAALDIPTIFLTGLDRTHISIDPNGRNPYLILYKPVPHDVLIRSIENALHLIEERMINAELLARLQEVLGSQETNATETIDEVIQATIDQINLRRSA